MNKDTFVIVLAMTGFGLAGFGLGVILTFCMVTGSWESEAIEKGHAEYNQTTGQWQWKQKDDE